MFVSNWKSFIGMDWIGSMSSWTGFGIRDRQATDRVDVQSGFTVGVVSGFGLCIDCTIAIAIAIA